MGGSEKLEINSIPDSIFQVGSTFLEFEIWNLKFSEVT